MKKYLKKDNLIDLLIISIFTIIVFYSFYSNRINVGDDLTYHLNRFYELAKCFEEGQILPKIYPFSNHGYGYAAPLFYCDFFLYPFAILYHFGLSAICCYKLCVIFYTLLSNIIIYIIIKNETHKRDLALLVVILYTCANYHLQNIFIRSALGEVIAMSFIPLAIHSIYKILIKHEKCWAYLGISFSLLVMCHLISSLLLGLFFFVMIIIFIIINFKDKDMIVKTLLTILKGTILAILLTLWYLLPMMEQLHSQEFWLSINANYNNIYTSAEDIGQVLDFWVVNNIQEFSAKNETNVGFLLIFLSTMSLFIKQNKYINIIYCFCIILFLIILGIIPGEFLTIIQFYSRLYVIIVPLLCICILHGFDGLSNKYIKYVLFLFIGLVSIINTYKINSEALYNDEYYLENNADASEFNYVKWGTYDLDYNQDELGGGEYIPVGKDTFVDYNTITGSIKYVDTLGNLVDYSYDYQREFTRLIFEYDKKNDMDLVLPITYYKGYSGYELINGEWEKIDITYSPTYKMVILKAKKGNHVYMVKYTGTFVQYVSLSISCISFIGLLWFCIRKRRA